MDVVGEGLRQRSREFCLRAQWLFVYAPGHNVFCIARAFACVGFSNVLVIGASCFIRTAWIKYQVRLQKLYSLCTLHWVCAIYMGLSWRSRFRGISHIWSFFRVRDWSSAIHCVWWWRGQNYNLVDPASSHMLVSKNKPCKSKCNYLRWNYEWLIKTVAVFIVATHYMDNCNKYRANACFQTRFCRRVALTRYWTNALRWFIDDS